MKKEILEWLKNNPEEENNLLEIIKENNIYYSDGVLLFIASLEDNNIIDFSLEEVETESDGKEMRVITYQEVGKSKKSKNIIWEYSFKPNLESKDTFIEQIVAINKEIRKEFYE
jgi:hypothetical protein